MVAIRRPDNVAHHRKCPARSVGESIPALPDGAGRHSAALNSRPPVPKIPAPIDRQILFTLLQRADLLAQATRGEATTLDRRQILAGLGTVIVTTGIPKQASVRRRARD